MDVLDRDFLRALAAVPVESFQQCSVCAVKLIRLIEILLSSLEGLFAEHCAPIALHRSAVAGEKLSHHHSLKFIARCNADHDVDRGNLLSTDFLRISIPAVPKRT